jgi:hypothetical protein
MESLRRRFMTPHASRTNASGSDSRSKPPEPQSDPNRTLILPAYEPSNIVIKLSNSKRINLFNGVATLYDSLGGTDVSKSSSREFKILALESLRDLLRLQGRNDLDPVHESPIVNRILETFASKTSCLEAINQCVSVEEHRRILTNWATDVWGEDVPPTASTQEDSDKDSVAGSLFSDSDVQEIPDNRVRPITLRPRKSSQSSTPSSIVINKSEFDKMSKLRLSEFTSKKQIEPRPLSSSERGVRGSSPRSRNSTSFRSAIIDRTKSSPSLRMQSSASELRDDYSEGNKKRTMRENVESGDHRVKRIKSSDAIPRTKEKPSVPTSIDTTKPESISLTQALDVTSTKVDEIPTSSAEFVSKYWRETSSKFPREVQVLPTIDRLAYYFKKAEFVKKENEILKNDERERRKSMVLMAEKLKLMNQPVSRGSGNGNGK